MERTQKEEMVKAREKLYVHRWIAPKYYDYPDGQDLFGKLIFVSKYTATVGACIGSAHAINTREQISFQMKCLRFSRVFIPCVGLGAAFTCVTYFSTVLRQKDDEVNYLYGGAVTGSLLGLFTGRFRTSAWMAGICGLAGLVKKTLHMNNLPVFGAQAPSRVNAPHFYHTWDFSFYPEKKGNWTK